MMINVHASRSAKLEALERSLDGAYARLAICADLVPNDDEPLADAVAAAIVNTQDAMRLVRMALCPQQGK